MRLSICNRPHPCAARPGVQPRAIHPLQSASNEPRAERCGCKEDTWLFLGTSLFCGAVVVALAVPADPARTWSRRLANPLRAWLQPTVVGRVALTIDRVRAAPAARTWPLERKRRRHGIHSQPAGGSRQAPRDEALLRLEVSAPPRSSPPWHPGAACSGLAGSCRQRPFAVPLRRDPPPGRGTAKPSAAARQLASRARAAAARAPEAWPRRVDGPRGGERGVRGTRFPFRPRARRRSSRTCSNCLDPGRGDARGRVAAGWRPDKLRSTGAGHPWAKWISGRALGAVNPPPTRGAEPGAALGGTGSTVRVGFSFAITAEAASNHPPST